MRLNNNLQPVSLERGRRLKEAVGLMMIAMAGIVPFIVIPLVLFRVASTPAEAQDRVLK